MFKPGNVLKSVWLMALATIANEKKELVPHFTSNCGFGMGLEFREVQYLLDGKNEEIFAPGMVFNFSLGFENLPIDGNLANLPIENNLEKANKNEGKKFAVFVADTLVVTENEPEILTELCHEWPHNAHIPSNEKDFEMKICDQKCTSKKRKRSDKNPKWV